MSYQSLYRKYRPSTFSDVVGQEAIVKIIKKAILREKIAHAYLFCGPRGTGKTSMAKLLAQGVNCTAMNGDVCNACENCLEQTQGNHPDIIEIDAASNNGVEEIRDLISKVKYTPIMGKYKVYIIDEVHMLSQGAFNALLKTLEEPPSHVIFVLATTEIQKVIPTIVSRCQRFDFTRINDQLIAKRLDKVMELEDIEYEQGVSDVIARLSGGGLRNALTILEQSMVYSDDKIKISDIYDVTGLVSNDDKIELIRPVLENDINSTLNKTKDILNRSHNVEQLNTDFIRALKDSIIYKETKNKDIISYEHIDFVEFLSENLSLEQIFPIMDILLESSEKMKYSQNQAVYFEISIIKAFRELNQAKKAPEIIELDPVIKGKNETGHTNESKPRKIELEPKDSGEKTIVSSNTSEKDVSRETEVEIKSNESEVTLENEVKFKPKQEVLSTYNSFENNKLMDQNRIIKLMVTADKEKRIEDIIVNK